MIRLFPADATTFETQGLGVLEAIRCPVTEERNGVYELEMEIAFMDRHYPDIALGRLILSKPNPYEDAEPFRIYQISRPMNGIVTVNACHWSYDLSKLADKPFTASSVTEAMSKLKTQSVDTCPFNFVTDKSVTGNFVVSTPSSIRSLLGGSQGSILDVYGKGEWKFTGRTCYLYLNRGQDRGVTIRYGKNLVDLTQEENNAKVYSKLYPYWADSDGHLVTLPEYTLNINTNGNGILVYDMSDRWDSAPTVQQLRTAAQSYIDSNDLDKPVVNLTLSFEQISDLVKDSIYLCDTLSVEFPALGVSAKAKVIKTVYDAVLDRYEKIEVGTVKQTLAQTITELQDNSVTGSVGKSVMQSAIDSSTAQITGNKGGYIVWHDSNQDGQPDELLVMDTPSIETAVKVWRFNKNGLGFSATGYDGEYALAMTADGAIVADMITVGTLSATLMRAGILKSLNYDSSHGTAGFSMNMETGEIFAPALVISAKNYTDTEVANALATAAADATSKANAAQAAAKSYTDTQISVIPGQISSAINNIQIGGTNLLRETKNFSNSGVPNDATGYLISVGPTTTSAEIQDFVVRTNASAEALSYYGQWLVNDCKHGETYTLSFWVKGSVRPRCYFYGPSGYINCAKTVTSNGVSTNARDGDSDAAGGISVSNDHWTRVWVTWTLANSGGTTDQKYVLIRNDNQAEAGSVYIAGAKFEKGNKATDWSPAPEDAENYTDNAVQSQAQVTSSQITQLSDRITSTVSTVNTIQSNMLDTADVNALINARNFATSTSVTQTSQNLQVLITQAQNTANAANSTAQTLTTGVTVDSNGVTVGKSNSAVKGVFSNNSLEFQSGGKAIAWLSANSEEGLGVDTIQIGNHNTANQRWIVFTSSDGSHLSFTRHQ